MRSFSHRQTGSAMFYLHQCAITSSASVTTGDDHQVLPSGDSPSAHSHCPCWQTISPRPLALSPYTQSSLPKDGQEGLKRFIRIYFWSFYDAPMECYGACAAGLTPRFKRSNSP